MPEVDKMELIYSLVGFPNETEWIEFKEGNANPERIGEDISALANAAAYRGREYAYKLWGVTDTTHKLVGTKFNPDAQKVGNEYLLMWLQNLLSPNANYSFDSFENKGLTFVVLTVHASVGQPVSFKKVPYVREGSSTKKLRPGSAKEAELWKRLQGGNYEMRVAAVDLLPEDIEELLDIDEYFSLLDMRIPQLSDARMSPLLEQGLLCKQDNGRYAITNLGALLIARRITSFDGLRKRALRVVRFFGKGAFDIVGDEVFDKGYALALPEAEKYIMSQSPSAEETEGAFRRIVHAYPQRAIRELLSNAVIHQDLGDATAGPLVMMYENRIEFSNPGVSLVPVPRVLNAQPKTRNTHLVGLMRQMDLCEEGGTGWDLVVASCERIHIAAPKIVSEEGLGTKVTLLAGSAYGHMTKAERRDATYWHACLMYAQGESMGNKSLRERFGLTDDRKNTVAISRLIRECCEEGIIKEEDEEAGDRYRRYVPNWA